MHPTSTAPPHLLLGCLAVLAVTACSTDPRRELGPPVVAERPPAPGPGDGGPRKPTPVPLPERAPEVFRVRFETTCGAFVVEARRDWAPRGTERFFQLVKQGFFEDVAFFRVIPGFVAQFGIHGDPETAARWRTRTFRDDPARQSNTRGTLTFASTGPGTRATQMFVNLDDGNAFLDAQGLTPFAKVVEGMDTVDRLFRVGDGAPRGKGPSPRRIQKEGNAYLKKAHPGLDYIRRAVWVPMR